MLLRMLLRNPLGGSLVNFTLLCKILTGKALDGLEVNLCNRAPRIKSNHIIGRKKQNLVRIDRVVAMQGSTRNKHDACGFYEYDSQRDPKHVFLIEWIGTPPGQKVQPTRIHMHPHASTRIHTHPHTSQDKNRTYQRRKLTSTGSSPSLKELVAVNRLRRVKSLNN